MTIYVSNPVTGPVVGQPISPQFAQQFAGALPTTAVGIGFGVAVPANMSILEAAGRSILPRNQYVTTVNSISTGAGDNASIDELMSTGNGNQSMRGAPVPPSGGVNDQQFTDGTSAVALQVNGPTQTNTEPQPLAPVSGAVLASNCGFAGFGG
jgi:hypothetical protein